MFSSIIMTNTANEVLSPGRMLSLGIGTRMVTFSEPTEGNSAILASSGLSSMRA